MRAFRFSSPSMAMVLLLAAGAVAFLAGAAQAHPTHHRADEPRLDRLSADDRTRLAFLERRTASNPLDGLSWKKLGDLRLRLAREDGSVTFYREAERALRRAVQVLPEYVAARVSLAEACAAQHRFTEALELVRAAAEADAANLRARAVEGDALLALGRYDAAEEVYRELANRAPSSPVLARQAHLAELRGDVAGAVGLMQRAVASLPAGAGDRDAAWYSMRAGMILSAAGRLDEAAAAYSAALDRAPGWPVALAGLARVRAAQGRGSDAAALLREAVTADPEPGHLIALGDLLAATGDPDGAERSYERAERIALRFPGVYDRPLILLYVERKQHLDRALELARREVAARDDIYASDVLAWTLFTLGRIDEAESFMLRALRLGTADARLHYHAGTIAAARGLPAQARHHLERALAIHPRFHPLDAPRARATLESLPGPADAGRPSQ